MSEFGGKPRGEDVDWKAEKTKFEEAAELRDALRPAREAIFQLTFRNYEMSEEEKEGSFRLLEQSKHLFPKALELHHLSAVDLIRDLSLLTTVQEFEGDKGDFHDNKYVKFALEQILELSPFIEEAVRDKTRFRGILEKDAVDLYEELAKKGSGKQKAEAATLLDMHSEYIFAEMLKKDKFHKNTERFSIILNQGNEEEARRALEKFEQFLATATNYTHIAFTLSALYGAGESRISLEDRAEKAIIAQLEKYGLPKEVLQDWAVSTRFDSTHNAIFTNLMRLGEIESEVPGIAKFLYQEYGIADFGRYPKEMLIKQYKEKDVTNKPYGVIIYPRTDWNGAFYHDIDKFTELLKQLKGEFLLRVAECESKIDIARVLINFDKKYNLPNGDGQKISLLILGGHGSETSIQFGWKSDEMHNLNSSDLAGKGVRKTGGFFEDEPTIILASCSTGAEAGIAQELSKTFNAKVIAPKIPTNVLGYYGSRKKGQKKFRFHARFRDKDAKNLYEAGHKTK